MYKETNKKIQNIVTHIGNLIKKLFRKLIFFHLNSNIMQYEVITIETNLILIVIKPKHASLHLLTVTCVQNISSIFKMYC